MITHPDPAPSAALNPFLSLVNDQNIAVLDRFVLQSGTELTNVEIAYKTWGKLNENRDNVMVICHALTGSADVEDWWGPMLGPGLAFDPSRYFIFCANVFGSPYCTSSPMSLNPATGERWGPEFPQTTIRDCVRLHKHVLDHLNVNSVAVVVGGSMGGMTTLEWPLCTPPGYIKHIIPIATSLHHSAWGISWGEGQRQSIYTDPKYADGWYSLDDPPQQGLASARMAALLTYRSRDSFESRFGRKEQVYKVSRPSSVNSSTDVTQNGQQRDSSSPDSQTSFPYTPAEKALAAHNEGNRNTKIYDRASSDGQIRRSSPTSQTNGHSRPVSAATTPVQDPILPGAPASTTDSVVFAAQSYLRYQGDKFVSRFDPNCYISMTRQMDSHSILRDRSADPEPLSLIPSNALVIAISTDGLFTINEQREIAKGIKGARLVIVDSPEGHDGFLLEFKTMNQVMVEHLHEHLAYIYEGEPSDPDALQTMKKDNPFVITKTSTFGEAEAADITAW